MKLHFSSMWHEFIYLLIISTIFFSHLHWSIWYDWCLLVHINKLVGYSDSDWCKNIDNRKSTSLGTKQHLLGFQRNNRSWHSRRVKLNIWQQCVCHAIWLRNLLSKMELKQLGATMIQVDNKSAIESTKNPVNHERSKHIDVRFHFIRDHVKEGSVELLHVASQNQVANIFTKPLLKILFRQIQNDNGHDRWYEHLSLWKSLVE